MERDPTETGEPRRLRIIGEWTSSKKKHGLLADPVRSTGRVSGVAFDFRYIRLEILIVA
jgi:hypothetical protein